MSNTERVPLNTEQLSALQMMDIIQYNDGPHKRTKYWALTHSRQEKNVQYYANNIFKCVSFSDRKC